MSKAEKNRVIQFVKDNHISFWDDGMDMDEFIQYLTDFANEQTQSLKDEIKELKKQSFIEKVSRGNIEMTPSQVLEYAELKDEIEAREGESLLLVQGYYNWIFLNEPSVSDILDRLEIERKQILSKLNK